MKIATRFMYVALVASCALLSGRVTADTGAGNADPTRVRIVTSDVPNFIKAFADASTSKNPAKIYAREYFAPGSAGLRGFIPNRLISPEHLAQMTHDYRAYYAAAIPSLAKIPAQRTLILADLERYKRIYPQAVFPDVYFVVGAMNSGGTSVENIGVVIGAEKYGRPASFKNITLPPKWQNTISPVEMIAPVVAHELTHYNQHDADDTTLLDKTLNEGSADFMAQLVDGHNVVASQWSFGCAHESELWNLFETQMRTTNEAKVRPWLYSFEPGPLKSPPFIGYWLGSRIVQSYYDSHADKVRAIDAILHIKNFQTFLEQSGYPNNKPSCAPIDRVD